MSEARRVDPLHGITLKAMVEHLVDRRPLPRGTVIRVDRIDPANAEDFLGIKSERVGLEPIHRRDRDLLRPLLD